MKARWITLLLATTALSLSAQAHPDDGWRSYGYDRDYGHHYEHHGYREGFVVRSYEAPAYVAYPVVTPPPPVIYRERIEYRDSAPVIYAPAPTRYYAPPPPPRRYDNGDRVVGQALGALAGGVIGNSMGNGNGRMATTAIGAIVGGVIGGRMAE